LKRRDTHYFASEYAIKAPGWSCFSENEDGSSPSWNVLSTGRKTLIDGIDYVVTGEYCRLDYPERVIILQATGRFDNIKLSAPMQIAQTDSIIPVGYASDMQRRSHTAFNAIIAGNVVSIRQDGSVEKALPELSHYGRLYGIALNAAEPGGDVNIQTGNRITVNNWGLQPGKRYFLRYDAVTPGNIALEPLYGMNETETMFACIGIAETENTLNIEGGMNQQYLFE
jgi:hypothetical protein